jgi:hypothetical protein
MFFTRQKSANLCSHSPHHKVYVAASVSPSHQLCRHDFSFQNFSSNKLGVLKHVEVINTKYTTIRILFNILSPADLLS